MADPADSKPHRIPVLLVTGFLGSGKTTLVNYVLKARGERNIAVVENEIGEVNIDSDLVAENLVEKEDIVSLDQGCVCCSLRKDIVKALADIETRSFQRNKPVDAVLLETTGLADPAPVAFTFFANPWISSRYRLDSILCVVDARYIVQHVNDEARGDGVVNEAAQQLAFADMILLNKTDLVEREELDKVMEVIRSINATAALIECQLNSESGRPPLSAVLGTGSFCINRALQLDPSFLDSESDSDRETEEAYAEEEEPLEAEAFHKPAHHRDEDQAPPQQCKDQCKERSKEHCTEHAEERSASEPVTDCAHAESERARASAALALRKDARRAKRRRKHFHESSGVGSVGIVANGPLDEFRFNMFMRDLLAEKSRDIFRCKGVLCVQGYGNTKFVFQGVHETICYGPSEKPWRDDEVKLNQVVFVGKNLDRRALVEGFRSCLWAPLEHGWVEYHDPMTNLPYFYNSITKEKRWNRPTKGSTPHCASPPVSMPQTACTS